MAEVVQKLANAPIVEAVVDIDCDMPPTFDLANLEKSATDAMHEKYPLTHKLLLESIRVEDTDSGPTLQDATHGIHALQFLQEDKKQLVQFRSHGYSFNRLAPYSGLDDYLEEIKRTWERFVAIAAPLQVRDIRLRYINRIPLPFNGGKIDLKDFLKVSPQLPDESNLTFVGFLTQHVALESGTCNQANIILTTLPVENEKLPLIFDITVSHPARSEVGAWSTIDATIQSLRSLKNRIFRNTLTDICVSLFQHSE